MATKNLNVVKFALYKGARENGELVETTLAAGDAIILGVNIDKPAPRQPIGKDGGFDGIKHALKAIGACLRFGRFDMTISEPGLYLFNNASHADEDVVDRVGTVAATYNGTRRVYNRSVMGDLLFAPISAFDGAFQCRKWTDADHRDNSQEYYRIVHQVLFGKEATHVWIAQARDQAWFKDILDVWTSADSEAAWTWYRQQRNSAVAYKLYPEAAIQQTSPKTAMSLPVEGVAPKGASELGDKTFKRVVGHKLVGVIALHDIKPGVYVEVNTVNKAPYSPVGLPKLVNLAYAENVSYWDNLNPEKFGIRVDDANLVTNS